MTRHRRTRERGEDLPTRVDVFVGGAPLLEHLVGEGLVEFGLRHPRWRFSMRGADFRYTARWLREQAIDGVLVLIDASAVARTLDRAGIPWVHLLPGRPTRHPNINVDNRAIGRMGAEFLLRQGFLRCAFCGVGTSWSAERAEGFRERLSEAGRPCLVADIPFAPDEYWGLAAGGDERLRRWVARLDRGMAVMAAHDALANRLVDTCLQMGKRVPNDVAVLGVGNHELLCRLSPVPISSINAGVPDATYRAAELLSEMVQGRLPAAVAPIAPQGVTERASTKIRVYGDDVVAKAVDYIQEHAGDRLRVEDLLKTFPVSRRTLSRRFAAYVGHSPAAEIRQARLRLAHRLVMQTPLSLTEIAATAGYADLAHMDRAFRKAMNDSPGGVRATADRRRFRV